MKLGAFEELVLLAVGALKDDAYGVSIRNILKQKANRTASIGALHSALYRLEDKGFLKSWEGGATGQRGGRRKKYYVLTPQGIQVLKEVHQLRMELSRNIKDLNLGIDG